MISSAARVAGSIAASISASMAASSAASSIMGGSEGDVELRGMRKDEDIVSLDLKKIWVTRSRRQEVLDLDPEDDVKRGCRRCDGIFEGVADRTVRLDASEK